MSISYNVDVINPFLQAVLNVLSTMAQVEARPGRPFISKDNTAKGDVTGLIGITGHTTGTISLTMSKGAILAIVSNMLMEEHTEVDAEIVDAVGELTNMIAGQARRALSEIDMHFQASTPTVVTGLGHSVDHVAGSPILAIPFDTDNGDFLVEVCFKDSEDSPDLPEQVAAHTA